MLDGGETKKREVEERKERRGTTMKVAPQAAFFYAFFTS
jgi:hypothetical protein